MLRPQASVIPRITLHKCPVARREPYDLESDAAGGGPTDELLHAGLAQRQPARLQHRRVRLECARYGGVQGVLPDSPEGLVIEQDADGANRGWRLTVRMTLTRG